MLASEQDAGVYTEVGIFKKEAVLLPQVNELKRLAEDEWKGYITRISVTTDVCHKILPGRRYF